ncbi:torsin-1A, partial [Biomphalaria pfeifferi]
LRIAFHNAVFGQHIAEEVVVKLIKGHIKDSDPTKALVLTFHGPPGVGKTFVSLKIAESLYRRGIKSKFVQNIFAVKEFPDKEMVERYKAQLRARIEESVAKCERSLFIIDEVDKIPATLLDALVPYMDSNTHVNGINYRKSIFLLLSNTAGSNINEIAFKHWKSGMKRETLKLSDLENELMKQALNVERISGLRHSELISRHLVSAFIPFLPLAKEHVRSCIREGLVARKYFSQVKNVPEDVVDRIVKELTFFPEIEQVFSINGCRRVTDKISFVMEQMRSEL